MKADLGPGCYSFLEDSSFLTLMRMFKRDHTEWLISQLILVRMVSISLEIYIPEADRVTYRQSLGYAV